VLNGGDETGLNVKDLQLQYSVPEPSTWILSGLGLLGLSLYRRR
jgi:hypothetical protein